MRLPALVIVLTAPALAFAPSAGVERQVRSHTNGATTGSLPPDMVALPGGDLDMGLTEEAARELAELEPIHLPQITAALPRHRVTLPAFLVDRHEITNLQYQTFEVAIGLSRMPSPIAAWPPWRTGRRYQRRFPPGQEDHPVQGISYLEAAECARWLGKRLPTEPEWEFAARHRLQESQYFPWSAQGWDGWDREMCANLDSRRLGSEGAQTFPVGSFSGDQTPDGILDLCGNVAEWTSSPFQAYPGWNPARLLGPSPRSQIPAFGAQRKVIRGGSIYGIRVSNNLVLRGGEEPDTRVEAVGFRCATSPRPGLDALHQAAAALAPAHPDLRQRLDFGPDAMVGQTIHHLDPVRELILGHSVLAFTRVREWPATRQAATGEPVPLGILTTSRSLHAPALPPGDHALYLQRTGSRDELLVRDEAGAPVAVLPLDQDRGEPQATSLRYTLGRRVWQQPAGDDEAEIVFVLEDPAAALPRRFTLRLRFPPDSFASLDDR